MTYNFFQYSIILRKLVYLAAICGWLVLSTTYAGAQQTPVVKKANEFKSWEINYFRRGGIKGIKDESSLAHDGTFRRNHLGQIISKKIKVSELTKITNLIEQLNLPESKTKVVAAARKIPDMFYTSFSITLDGIVHKLEGSAFKEEQRVELSKRQLKILGKLRKSLSEIGF